MRCAFRGRLRSKVINYWRAARARRGIIQRIPWIFFLSNSGARTFVSCVHHLSFSMEKHLGFLFFIDTVLPYPLLDLFAWGVTAKVHELVGQTMHRTNLDCTGTFDIRMRVNECSMLHQSQHRSIYWVATDGSEAWLCDRIIGSPHATIAVKLTALDRHSELSLLVFPADSNPIN